MRTKEADFLRWKYYIPLSGKSTKIWILRSKFVWNRVEQRFWIISFALHSNSGFLDKGSDGTVAWNHVLTCKINLFWLRCKDTSCEILRTFISGVFGDEYRVTNVHAHMQWILPRSCQTAFLCHCTALLFLIIPVDCWMEPNWQRFSSLDLRPTFQDLELRFGAQLAATF